MNATIQLPANSYGLALARAVIALVLVCGLVLACHKPRKVLDNSNLIIQPGLGISNLCEVGMTFAQIKNATGDASTRGRHYDPFWRRPMATWGRGDFVFVPSLAAIATIGENQPTSAISFYVQPHREPLVPDLDIQKPFRGKLGTELTFKDDPVRKLEVEKVFGSISQIATNGAHALEFRKKSERFSRCLRDSVEELWYPDQGIAFRLTSNVVTSLWVFKASGTNRSADVSLDSEGSNMLAQISFQTNRATGRSGFIIFALTNASGGPLQFRAPVAGATFAIWYRREGDSSFVSYYPPGTYVQGAGEQIGKDEVREYSFSLWLPNGDYEVFCTYSSDAAGLPQSWRGELKSKIMRIRI